MFMVVLINAAICIFLYIYKMECLLHLFLYIMIALSLIATIAVFLNKHIKQTNWYMNSIPDFDNYPGNDWYRNHSERNYDVVNVGSSSGLYAFDYSGTGVKAFNWAMQPQSMEYSFRVLKNYFSILKKNGVVIIPFSPFSGLYSGTKWSETSYGRYYYILDYTLIDNYEKISRFRKWPLFYYPKESVKRLIKDVARNRSGKKYNVCHNDIEFEKDAEMWINGWMKEFNISDLNLPKSKENIDGAHYRMDTIKDMIKFCIERDLRPVIVIPPMHHTLTNKLTSIFRENYIYSFIRELDMFNVPFYDYMDDKAYDHDSYFYNSYFMSESGAKVFTKDILHKLNLI